MESKIYYSTNPVYANKPSARSKLPIPLQAHKALSARKGDAGAAYAAGHPTRSNYTLIEDWRVRLDRSLPIHFRIAVGLRAIDAQLATRTPLALLSYYDDVCDW